MNIQSTLKNACLALIFFIPFIPLYVANNLFFPFITGKAFAFRIAVEIAFALWLLLVLRDKKYAPRFSWLSLGVTVFAIAIFVSDIFGLNPIRSLWSNFERMEGWVTIIHLWAYFIVITSLFGVGEEGKRMWHRFFNVSIFAAVIVGFYGVFQLFNPTLIHQGSSRIDASLGNAAYMAVYMLFHVFISLYMSFVERGRKKMGLSWMYAVIAVFFSFILLETSTRGTVVGLVGGGMLALFIYSVFGKGEAKKDRIISAGVIAAIILLGVLFYLNRNASFIQKHEPLQRLASISINDTKTQARGYIWPMAIKGTFADGKTTVIGVGQENFNYIFNANYNPLMWSQEQWFDRAHSVFLDWLVAGGIVGLVLYLLLYIFTLIYLWKSEELAFREKCIFTGLIVAYAIHNIFVFDNLISYILFFTVLGFAHSNALSKPMGWFMISDKQTENKIIVRDYIYMPVIVIFLLATLYLINIRVIQANTRLIAALNACSSGGMPSMLLFDKVFSLNQYVANQEAREQLLSCASSVAGSSLSTATKTDFYNLTKKEIEKQIQATPNDARAYVLGGAFFDNVSDWASAKPLLEKAHELSPGKQTIDFELATNYLNTGMQKEAEALLEKAYVSDPTNDNAKMGYITLLILNGDEKKAYELFGNEPEIFADQRVINAYLRLKNFPKVVELYKILIAKDPENIQLHGSLAATYLAADQKAQALSELRYMAKKFPAIKSQVEQVIKDIEAGKNPLQ